MPANLAPITVESDFEPAQTSHYISFGAGVQSTVLYLMAAQGDFLPLPAAAIFADTGWEPQQVYDHLDWVESLGLPIPIVRVQAANLYSNLWDAKRAPGQGQTPYTDIPAFVYNAANVPKNTKSTRSVIKRGRSSVGGLASTAPVRLLSFSGWA